MPLTIAYSKIKKRNLVLINNATYQRETLSERPIRQPLRMSKLQKLEKGSILQVHNGVHLLKVDMPILTHIFFTFNWLTLTSEMHFVKFHPEVASCLLSRGKRKYAPLGMRLIWKYIRNYFLVYQLISHFLLYLQNYKEFEAKILDLQPEKYGLSFDIKKMYYFRLSPGGWECDRHKGL